MKRTEAGEAREAKVNQGKVVATKRRRGAQRPQPVSRAKGT